MQSNGYIGNGFAPANPGQPPDAALNNLFIQALPAPPPQIVFRGNNVAQTTQTVYVGQQIALSVPAPTNGLTVQSQSWSNPPGTAVGGYTASAASGVVIPLPAPTGPRFTFYWVDAGTSRQMTYTWTLSNGTSNSANVTFSVIGPTPTGSNGAFMTATVGTVNVWPADVAFNGRSKGFPGLEFGNSKNSNGIDFNVTATSPNNNGTFQWVQVIRSNTTRYLSSTPTPNGSLGVGFDN